MAGFPVGRGVFILGSAWLIVLAGGGSSFLRRPVGIVYLALWVVWWVATFAGRRRGETTPYDRNQHAIVVVTGSVTVPLLILAPSWEYAHFAGPLPRDGPLAWSGISLFAAGMVLQIAAMRALGSGFTVRLGVQPGRKLVTSGPYRYIRHPGYASYLMSVSGIGFAMGSLVMFAVVLLIVPFILWRIKNEEAMLLSEFREEHSAYMRRTWRLVPFVY